MTAALLVVAALGAMVLAHRERTGERATQRTISENRLRRGQRMTPLPPPGVFARHNAVDTPALLPDGTTERAVGVAGAGRRAARPWPPPSSSTTSPAIQADMDPDGRGSRTDRRRLDGKSDIDGHRPGAARGAGSLATTDSRRGALTWTSSTGSTCPSCSSPSAGPWCSSAATPSSCSWASSSCSTPRTWPSSPSPGCTATSTGQTVALFVMLVAAAEVVIGLAIIMAIFRTRRSASVDDANLLKY